MTGVRFGLVCCVGMLILFGGLKLANLKGRHRYQQFWLLSAAVFYVSSFLLLNDQLISFITDIIYQVFPVLESYTVVTINLLLLSLFLVLKFGGQQTARAFRSFRKKKEHDETLFRVNAPLKYLISLLPEGFRQRLLRKDPATVAIVYAKKEDGVYLKPEWVFSRVLFMYCTWISAIVLLVLAFSISFEWNSSVVSIVGEYPALSFILFAEFAWFFGGDLPEKNRGWIHGQDVVLNKYVDYEQLYEEYKRLWPDRILKTDILMVDQQRQEHYYYEKMTGNLEVQLKINQLCERLKREGSIIRESYCRIFRDIIEGKDVLIEDPFYTDLAAYLFPAIYSLLAGDRKLAVLASSRSHAEEIVTWLQKGIRHEEGVESVFIITTFHQAIEQNQSPDVVVLTPADLINPTNCHYLHNQTTGQRIDCIIVAEGERIINEHGMVVHHFMQRVKDLGGIQPQSIVLSKWQEDLEQTVRHLLSADPCDTEPILPVAKKMYYMLWKKEGDDLFQHQIMERMVHRRIEVDAVLSIPAVKYGIERMAFLNQARAPIQEGLEELKDNQEQLFSYTMHSHDVDSLFDRSVFHSNHLSVPLEDYQFAIVRDQENNVVDSLSQWLCASKEIGFIHVVSPPYLLRDYLTDCVDYYIGNNRKISPISVRVSSSKWSSAYNLLERLCTGKVSEKEVQEILNRHSIPYETLSEGICMLLNDTFKQKMEFKQLLDIESELRFNRQKIEFEEHVYYRLPGGLINSLLPTWFALYEIKTQTGIVLDSIMKGHVYQNYQVGQLCSFHGKLYKVQQIDHNRGIVELSFEVPHVKEQYRTSRSYHLFDSIPKAQQIERMDRYTINTALYDCDVQVYSKGYFSFEQAIDLVSEKTKFIPAKKEDTARIYRNGKVLEIKICSLDQEFQYSTQIAFTLSFLLNEVFVTLFPYSYQYLAACTPLPDSYFADDSFGGNLKLLMPELTYTGELNSEGQFTLYIIEDSPFHMGILESIRARFSHILEILDDYLYWLLEESEEGGHTNYIKLGAPHVSDYFNLTETADLVRKLLPSNSLRENRLTYQTSGVGPSLSMEEARKCDFCGEMLPVSEFDVLNDGRERCYQCTRSAIDTVEALKPLNDLVRKAMRDSLAIKVKNEIQLEMVSSGEIQRRMGDALMPTLDQETRVVGRAMMNGDHDMSVVIENGFPKHQTISTLAHEFTHIWQYEHLPYNDLPLEILEGHAVWTEIYICEQLGEQLYAEKIKAIMQLRDDVYGNGYRHMLELLKEKNCHNPFELLKSEEATTK